MMPNTTIELKPSRNFFLDLLDNERAALHVLAGSRKAFQYVNPTAIQFVFLSIAALAVNTLFSWLVADGNGHFNRQGLISYSLWPFIALITGIFLAQRQGMGRLLLVPAIFWLTVDINIALLQSLLQSLANHEWLPSWLYSLLPTLYMVIFIWQTVSVMWIFGRQLNWPWWELTLILLTSVVFLGVWSSAVESQPIWKTEAEENNQPRLTFPEAAVYTQPRLLEDATAQIASGIPNKPEWFFLGIGGAAYQDVFKFEAEQVQRMMENRFHMSGRSMILVNNPATQFTLPIASRTSIDRAIAAFGKKMNPEDVLFLFITSHGGRDLIELSNEPLSLDQITPQWLRESLDRANIPNRVVVLSSCYSGSFVPTLQSPDTIIITASDADHTSFGCTSAPEYTYFGRAFFEESLLKKRDIRTAFSEAQMLIKHREDEQDFPHSNPQMKIGPDIEKRLNVLQQSW